MMSCNLKHVELHFLISVGSTSAQVLETPQTPVISHLPNRNASPAEETENDSNGKRCKKRKREGTI